MDADDELNLLRFHRFLLTETRARLPRFREAIVRTVRPGDTVLDLGTGSGILAFLACRAGARRVYAVDVEAAVELARLLATENGFGDRVVARSVKPPAALEQSNPNLVGGDINGGVQDVVQFLFRPAVRLDPYSTSDPRIFICSASTPPGGAVHGMCGYYAARSVMRHVKRG